MLKKIDLSGAKNFFFEKGEKIGIALCGLALAFFLFQGYSAIQQNRGDKRGRTFAKAMEEDAGGYLTQMENATYAPEDLNKSSPLPSPDWTAQPSAYVPSPLFTLSDQPLRKRVNPKTMPIIADPAHFQMDLVKGLYLKYEIDPVKKSISGFGDKNPQAAGVAPMANLVTKESLVQNVQPARMVVVSAVFPIRLQLEEFRQAFRMLSREEVLSSPENLPRFLGMNIYRQEIVNGKEGKWEPLYAQVDGKQVLAPSVREMMRTAIFDEENPRYLAFAIYPGLTTPLPKLAYGEYPKLKIKALEAPLDFVDGFKLPANIGGMKPPAGMNAENKEIVPVRWDKLPRELQDRFGENYILFDPLGLPVETEAPKGGGLFRPGNFFPGATAATSAVSPYKNPLESLVKPLAAPLNKDGKEETIPQPPVESPEMMPRQEPQDGLVRFVDPEVLPGRSYRYSIQVRLANPNYGKKDLVSYPMLAEIKELDPSPPIMTPTITVGPEYFFYAVDQMPEKRIRNGSDTQAFRMETGSRADQGTQSQVPIQIHRWVEKTADQNLTEFMIGDWAIAERLLVRRGEPLGRSGVMIEVPVWNKKNGRFEIGNGATALPKPKPAVGFKPGKDLPEASALPIDMIESHPPAMLVDFEGGTRHGFRDRLGYTYLKDESAIDLLILTSDGKLIVRNTRVDSETDTPEGMDRIARYQAWRNRLTQINANNNPMLEQAPNMPALPGIGLPGVRPPGMN